MRQQLDRSRRLPLAGEPRGNPNRSCPLRPRVRFYSRATTCNERLYCGQSRADLGPLGSARPLSLLVLRYCLGSREGRLGVILNKFAKPVVEDQDNGRSGAAEDVGERAVEEAGGGK